MEARIALFGGSFDPIHLGHTQVARYAAQQLSVDQVVFIPAKRSPHKPQSPMAGDHHRLEMIRRAIADDGLFDVSDCELVRGDPSYTLHTIRWFRDFYGADSELFWLVGADMVPELHRWFQIDRIIDECHLCIMRRASSPVPDFSNLARTVGPEQVRRVEACRVETPLIAVSSSQIRCRIALGQDVADQVCPAVWAYIKENQLYRGQNAPETGGF